MTLAEAKTYETEKWYASKLLLTDGYWVVKVFTGHGSKVRSFGNFDRLKAYAEGLRG